MFEPSNSVPPSPPLLVLFENCNLFPWKTQLPADAAHLDTVERLAELQRLLIPNYLYHELFLWESMIVSTIEFDTVPLMCSSFPLEVLKSCPSNLFPHPKTLKFYMVAILIFCFIQETQILQKIYHTFSSHYQFFCGSFHD